MTAKPSNPWFRAKRYGYGSGLPMAWQGWVVLALYLLVTVGAAFVLPRLFPRPEIFTSAIFAVTIVASLILGVICARKTQGGWRWRSGDES
ncbi:hypothetical protein ABAC460_08805 [Asticcacaulis sp. AC460]|uniref:hypothetical protein n=1 Tax=Asticcacaulis sp. AC460 TaxID=1282360 RepID=UPI0003C3BC78|nr:hypothetical protein [Asticcacaulis sp. AC460]ESQ90577.1 hypothetical protein ABAC460_08805 [Asticcacaulis sp. AC460]